MAYLPTMEGPTTDGIEPTRSSSRWRLARLWAIGLVIYLISISVAPSQLVPLLNDLGWTLAALVATLVCLRTALRIEAPGRKAWGWIAAGCVSWFVGQMYWNFNRLVLGIAMPYPNFGQIFYAALAVCLIVGILQMPEVRQGVPLTRKHLGNVGLVVCCLVASGILGLLEPVLRTSESGLYLLVGGLHSLLLAGTFLVALFALWTYSWDRAWTSMLLLVIATGIYSVTNLVYAHALLTGSYLESDAINASWCIVFGCIAWAAYERWWLDLNRTIEAPKHMFARERWVEAVVPALLIVIMMAVTIALAPELSKRTLAIAAGVFVAFALILGAREAWIQSETQRLNDALMRANRRVEVANTELQTSEQRYRELNRELEARVTERTTALERAYAELEGFSYAVAHDLKAPLRSINSFAHLLHRHLESASTPEIDSYLARIRSGSLKMAALIDDLLEYSHVERRALSVVPVDARSTVDAVLAQFSEEMQRRQVKLQLDIQPIRLLVDAEGLLVVLRNLIENALKYSHADEPPSLRISVQRNGSTALLEVADRGIGFEMAHHDQIFRIFQRLHRDDEYPGTGIGLALVRKAVERMHGRVWARSEPGRGARFFVELPAEA